MAEVRDRIASPSINFPQSEEEAFQAIIHQVRRVLFEDNALNVGALNRTYTTDAGLGHTRTKQAAEWLTAQQELVRARLEDVLDALDLEHRTI